MFLSVIKNCIKEYNKTSLLYCECMCRNHNRNKEGFILLEEALFIAPSKKFVVSIDVNLQLTTFYTYTTSFKTSS